MRTVFASVALHECITHVEHSLMALSATRLLLHVLLKANRRLSMVTVSKDLSRDPVIHQVVTDMAH